MKIEEMNEIAKSDFVEHRDTFQKISNADLELLSKAAKLVADCHRNGGRIFTAGNGGSAADAQHFASELRENSINAESLTTNTSYLLAIGNDYGFNSIFSRQVTHLGKEGDVLCVYTISGTSPNILAAVEEAKKKNMKIIVFTSRRESASSISDSSDISIRSPSSDMQRCQEYHEFAYHTIWHLVMKEFDIKYHK
ncbi:MAG: SIS domain-containing protein [Candidatus Aenigmarchaeota archaeon]|nr:SIS domain-containing protein [Candidatus Aenigmarchaeota archaeon]